MVNVLVSLDTSIVCDLFVFVVFTFVCCMSLIDLNISLTSSLSLLFPIVVSTTNLTIINCSKIERYINVWMNEY